MAKKGEMDDNTKIWRLECQANWTRRGMGVLSMDGEKGVVG